MKSVPPRETQSCNAVRWPADIDVSSPWVIQTAAIPTNARQSSGKPAGSNEAPFKSSLLSDASFCNWLQDCEASFELIATKAVGVLPVRLPKGNCWVDLAFAPGPTTVTPNGE